MPAAKKLSESESDEKEAGRANLALNQAEIENYKRLRGRVDSGRRGGRGFFNSLLLVLAAAGILVTFGWLYHKQDLAVRELDKRIEFLASENKAAAEMGAQLADAKRRLDSAQADITKLWALSGEQRTRQLEKMLNQINDQKVLLDTVAAKSEAYGRIVKTQQKLRATLSTLDIGYQQLVGKTNRLVQKDESSEKRIKKNEGAVQAIDKHRKLIARKLIEIDKAISASARANASAN